MTINDHLNKPSPTPLIITCDLVERLAPLNIQESSTWFANLVANRISDTGKHVDELTIKELRQIINECHIASKKAAKRKLFRWKYI